MADWMGDPGVPKPPTGIDYPGECAQNAHPGRMFAMRWAHSPFAWGAISAGRRTGFRRVPRSNRSLVGHRCAKSSCRKAYRRRIAISGVRPVRNFPKVRLYLPLLDGFEIGGQHIPYPVIEKIPFAALGDLLSQIPAESPPYDKGQTLWSGDPGIAFANAQLPAQFLHRYFSPYLPGDELQQLQNRSGVSNAFQRQDVFQ